ncbi:MAG: hypothetical protein B7Y25_03560 [Alphaproteobacteria bacterium 16-39-46]|nr:MAG: hypothetical protein B7Y25_03560 [Alphaproteobacteria bacterium 16-39-46]OZA43237.1 MAG: hypothetical protein B7X84_03785 [Alphaproteobacteria bacterium 17-39-52]HQS83993.1 GrpB family protein [Alphaproteobacteria bacterium]HQS93866.1 GrpB family protein [Alphaproteobacteria bacterium]
MSRILEVVPYDPLWPKLFEEEARKIKEALGEHCSSIHHIGSTSVVSLPSKPIIDTLVIVKTLKDNPQEILASLGYRLRGRIVTPLSDFYQRGTPQPKFHLHLYEEGDETAQLHFSVRQYLRDHPFEIDQYSQLKFDLQDKYKATNNYNEYRIEKSPFIDTLIQKSGFVGITLNYIKSTLNKNASEKDLATFKLLQKEHILPLTKGDETIFDETFLGEQHLYFSLKKGLTIVAVSNIEMIDCNVAFLRSIATDVPFQGKGYAQKFCDLLQKWAKSHDYFWVHLPISSKTDAIYRSFR